MGSWRPTSPSLLPAAALGLLRPEVAAAMDGRRDGLTASSGGGEVGRLAAALPAAAGRGGPAGLGGRAGLGWVGLGL